MAINTSIWGLPENWNTFEESSTVSVIKQPSVINDNTNYKTFQRLVEFNKLNINTDVDTSLCVSGMGSECPYSNINYYTIDNGAIVSDTQNRDITNWCFTDVKNNSLFEYESCYLYKDGYKDNVQNYDEILTETFNNNRDISPFIDYDIKNFVLLLKVEFTNSPTGAKYYSTLDEYINNWFSNYPYVTRIYAKLYNKFRNNPIERNYIYQGVIEGDKYNSSIILNNYETTLLNENNRKYCLHFASRRNSDIPVWGSSVDKTTPYFPYNEYEEHGLIGIVYGDINDFETTIQNNNFYVYHHVTDITAFAEKARRAAAAFGCYFTGDSQTAEYGELTDTKMYIGVLDDNLIAHGDYLQGTDTANAIQNTWDTVRDSTYNPTANIDNSKYNNGTNFNLWDFSLNCVNKFYVLTTAQVEQLSTELYTIMSSVSSDIPIERYNQTVFLTQNPIDCIVSIKRFPVDVPYIGTSTTLKLGSQTTSISAHYLLKPCNVYYFNFSNSTGTGLYKTFGGSFLDFEPYTKVSINVPFCGSFDVPCNYFHKYGGVDVALLIDFVTGACTAFLMVNGNVVDSIQGECGVNVPLSGLQTATIDSQIFNASMSKQKQDNNFALSMLGGAAAIALGVATGGAAAVVGGAAALTGSILNKSINDKSIDYDLQHMQAPIKQVSSASPVIARANDMRCKMIISRPEYMDNYNETVYAETIGFACLINTTVNNLSGLTVGDINLDGLGASDVEKQLIKNAFAGGVIL